MNSVRSHQQFQSESLLAALQQRSGFAKNLQFILETLLERLFRNDFANIFRDKSIVSYGSCQFPTLGFIVERYQAIKNFISEKFWKISLKHIRDNVIVDFSWDRQHVFDYDIAQVSTRL